MTTTWVSLLFCMGSIAMWSSAPIVSAFVVLLLAITAPPSFLCFSSTPPPLRGPYHQRCVSLHVLCVSAHLQDFYASHKQQVEQSKPYVKQYGEQRLPKYMWVSNGVLARSMFVGVARICGKRSEHYWS